MYVMKDFGLQF